MTKCERVELVSRIILFVVFLLIISPLIHLELRLRETSSRRDMSYDDEEDEDDNSRSIAKKKTTNKTLNAQTELMSVQEDTTDNDEDDEEDNSRSISKKKTKRKKTLSAQEKRQKLHDQTELIEKNNLLSKYSFYKRDATNIIPSTEKLVRFSGRSKIWDYFCKFANDQYKMYRACTLCHKKALGGPIHGNTINFTVLLSEKDKGCTSKMITHLKTYHREIRMDEVMLLDSATEDTKQRSISSFAVNRYETIYHKSLVEYVVNAGLPFSTANCPHFNKFMQKNNVPGYKHVNRQTLAQKVEELYVRGKSRLKTILDGKAISLTTDGWTSECQGLHYIGVTCHFIESWNLKSYVLACRHHSGSANASNYEEIILGICAEFGIKVENIPAITTDTEGKMSSFGALMQEKHRIPWIGCIDHRLQLVTNKACDTDVMKNVRELIGAVNYSTQASEALLMYQKVANPTKVPVGLIQECKTRWWTTFTTVERMLRLKVHLDKAFDERMIHKSYKLTLAQWGQMEELVQVLEPFREMQKMLEGESYITASLLPASLMHLEEGLNASVINDQNSIDVIDLITSMQNKFHCEFGRMGEKFDELGDKINDNGEYFNRNTTTKGGRRAGISVELLLATALDPRMKNLLGVPTDSKQLIWAELKKRAITLGRRAIARSSEQPKNTETSRTQATTGVNKTSFAAWFEREIETHDENISDTDDMRETQMSDDEALEKAVVMEIKKYRCQETRLDMYEEDGTTYRNPLSWWGEKEKDYPNLSRVALRQLCIPASSAPSERLFSIAGITIANDRSRMLPELSESLIFLRVNRSAFEDLF